LNHVRAEPKIDIIYQDEQILVINKPSGLSATKERTGSASLIVLLQKQFTEQLRLVHRLDKETSGVLVLAKSKQAQTLLSQLFEKRAVKKTYLVLATGTPASAGGTIVASLSPKSKNQNIFRIDNKKGKSAITDWRILANFGSVLLLAVNPLTGRTHQIRVHLPHIGLNLAVDPLYGSFRGLFLSDFKSAYRLGKNKTEKPLIARLTLHAYQLEFPHPISNFPRLFIAPLDKNFKAALKMLTKYNPKGLAAFAQPETYHKILAASKID
jgi:23S rRNA pseudouridine1911/1915/1917 synthase